MIADTILPDILSAGATIIVALIGFAVVWVKQHKTDAKVDRVERETEARNGETLTFREEVRRGFARIEDRLDRELGP